MFFTFIELILFILSEGYVPIACQKDGQTHKHLINSLMQQANQDTPLKSTLSKWKGIIYFEKNWGKE